MATDKGCTIIGPPGCGKTTTALDLVDKALANGIAPDRIAFVTFTRKGAYEAQERACNRFDLDPKDLPWFRTLHSMAYYLLGVSKDQVVTQQDYMMIGEWLKMDFSVRRINAEEGLIVGDGDGDMALMIDQLSRNRLLTPQQVWRELDLEISFQEVERFVNCYQKWKQAKGKLDFTDMLELVNDMPVLDLLIVDEAQDLTPLQWQMADKMAANAKESYWLGDDDQSIFTWAGASPQHLAAKAKQTGCQVLGQSYRLPKRIWQQAQQLSNRITGRIIKQWKPRDEIGGVHFPDELLHLPLEEGQWLLTARTNKGLDQYKAHLKAEGFLYSTKQGISIGDETVRAIAAWEQLRKGNPVTQQHALLIYDKLPLQTGVERGGKAKLQQARGLITLEQLQQHFGLLADGPWFEVMTKIGREREYIRQALRRGEKLSAPRIHLSTIHGTKGGEWDNVAIMPDLPYVAWERMNNAPNDEHRTFYVAATRAKEHLYWLSPQTMRFYEH